jgi:hypothetical protein
MIVVGGLARRRGGRHRAGVDRARCAGAVSGRSVRVHCCVPRRGSRDRDTPEPRRRCHPCVPTPVPDVNYIHPTCCLTSLETIIQKRGFSIIPSAGVRGLRGGGHHRSFPRTVSPDHRVASRPASGPPRPRSFRPCARVIRSGPPGRSRSSGRSCWQQRRRRLCSGPCGRTAIASSASQETTARS